MHEPLIVSEGKPVGLYRSFAICNQITQEPINGFDNLVMNATNAIEFARRLSATNADDEVEAIRKEAEQKSDQVQFDLYHL